MPNVSGVILASGFVDFASGRYSIVTAPGPGAPTQVKVFNFSLMTPIKGAAVPENCPGPTQAAVTSAIERELERVLSPA